MKRVELRLRSYEDVTNDNNDDATVQESLLLKMEDATNKDDNDERCSSSEKRTMTSIILNSNTFLANIPQQTTISIQTLLSTFNFPTNNNIINSQNIIIQNENGETPNNTICNKQKKIDDNVLLLFGVNIGIFSDYVIFVILISVVLVGFLLIGVVEEGFKYSYPGFNFGWYMTCIELLIFCSFAIIEKLSQFGFANIWYYYKNSSSYNFRIKKHEETFEYKTIDAKMTYDDNADEGQPNDIDNHGNTNCNTDCENANHINHLHNISTVENRTTHTSTNINDTNNKMKNDNDDNGNNVYYSAKNDNIDSTDSTHHKYEYKNIFQLVWAIVFERKVEMRLHFLVAISMTFSRALTNISLLLLNYPTQVVFKSMKLLFVMIGSRYVLNKHYTSWEYAAAPFMVLSAILFTIGDSTDALRFDFWGIICVCVSLIFDSIHANAQEHTLCKYQNTTIELLIYSNLISGILAGIIGTISGELIPIIKYFQQYNVYRMLGWFLIRAMCLYVGVAAFVVFTKKFGAVAAVTATTIRKIFTVLLSYLLWPSMKVFTAQHSAGTILFVLSLTLNAFAVKMNK